MRYCFLILFACSCTLAQSFEKGNHIIDLNLGLGLYTFTYEEERNGVTVEERSAGGSIPVTLSYEYGFLDFLSGGLMLRYQPFIDSSGTDLTVSSFEVGPVVNFHFLRTDKVDWSAGLAVGFSSFRWEEVERNNPFFSGNIVRKVEANGGFYSLHTKLRWYFSQNFGMNFGLALAGQNYSSGDYSDNVGNIVANNPLPLRAAGIILSVGGQLKF